MPSSATLSDESEYESDGSQSLTSKAPKKKPITSYMFRLGIDVTGVVDPVNQFYLSRSVRAVRSAVLSGFENVALFPSFRGKKREIGWGSPALRRMGIDHVLGHRIELKGCGSWFLDNLENFLNPLNAVIGLLNVLKYGMFRLIDLGSSIHYGLYSQSTGVAGTKIRQTLKGTVELVNWLAVLPMRLLTLPGKAIERACEIFANWEKASTTEKALAITGAVLGAGAIIAACVFAPVLIPLVAKGLAAMASHVFGAAAMSVAAKTVAAKACLWATVGLNGLKAVASAARSAFAWFSSKTSNNCSFQASRGVLSSSTSEASSGRWSSSASASASDSDSSFVPGR